MRLEQAVHEEGETNDEEKTAHANAFADRTAGNRDEEHEPKADAHHQNPGAPEPAGGTAVTGAFVLVHGAVKSRRIDFGWRDEPLLDHRDAFTEPLGK